MRKLSFACAGLAVMLLASTTAKAQTATSNSGLAVWYDVRSTAASILSPLAPFTSGQSLQALNKKKKKAFASDVTPGNLGGPGDGDVLRLSPRLPLNPSGNGFGLHVTGKKKKKDQSIKNIYAYMTVDSRGGVGEVISALGRDTVIRRQSTGPHNGTFSATAAGNLIENITVTPVATQWDGVAASAAPDPDTVGNPNGWIINSKQVKVPVADLGAGPVYDVGTGAVPGSVVKVGCIQVTAGVWAKGAKPVDSTFEGFDQVNNLLMARAVSTGGPAAAELPDMGYAVTNLGDTNGDGFTEFATGGAGLPEPAIGDGSTIGTTSTEADFTIIIQMKGDFNNSGSVTNADITPMSNAVSNPSILRQRQLWLADSNGSGTVTNGDIGPFQKMLNGTSTASCLVPTDCPVSGLGGPACP